MNNRRNLILGILVVLLVGSTITACSLSITGGITGGILTILLAIGLLVGTGTSQSGCSDNGAASQDTEEPDIVPCLSIIEDVGPCLGAPLPDVADDAESDIVIGPCLTAPSDVFAPKDTDESDIAPCLSVLPEDTSDTADSDEPEIGPCLIPPMPDSIEPADVEPADAKPIDTAAKDAEPTDVVPCLSIMPPNDTSDTSDTDDDASDAKDEPDLQPCLSPPPPPPPPNEPEQAQAPIPAESATLARADVQKKFIDNGTLPPDVAAALQGSDDESTAS